MNAQHSSGFYFWLSRFFHLSVTATIPRRALIALVWVPRCLSHFKIPQTSRKSLSGSWLPFCATSTLSNAPFLPGFYFCLSRFFHLSVTTTIPRRALIALVWVPSLSLTPQATPDEPQELVWVLAPFL